MRNDIVEGHERFIKRLRSRNYEGMYIKDEIVVGTDHYSTSPVGLAKGLRWIYLVPAAKRLRSTSHKLRTFGAGRSKAASVIEALGATSRAHLQH